MKRQPFFRLLAMMLALVMVLGWVPAVAAAPSVTPDRSHRLVETKAGAEAETHKPTDSVRVSIILEEPSVAEAGFSTSAVASNDQALSHHAALNRSQQTLAAAISRQVLGGKKLDVVWNLTLVTNLISANVPYGSLDAIRAMDGVRDVVIERQYSPDTAEQQTHSSAEMVGANVAWDTGLTGAGSRIAIVDTGTDTDHQSFDNGAYLYALERSAAEKGMTLDAYKESLNLLDTAWIEAVLPYLNATERIGAQAEEYYLSEKLPFAANYVDRDLTVDHDSDYQGSHGSHVAGIAAANRFIPADGGYADARQTVCMSGVAPDAQIITLKVFGNASGPYDSDYFAAIEDAIWLGCDSVNLSLGSGDPGVSGNDQFAQLLDLLATTDTVVVMSAGNSGHWAEQTANGLLYDDGVSFHTCGSPGTYTNSLAVASVENDGMVGPYFTVGDRMIVYTETLSGSNLPLAEMDYSADGSGKIYDYIFTDGYGTAADYEGMDLTGKVVFCSRGGCTFVEKANMAESLGALALVVYNNTSGTFVMDLSGYRQLAPCVSITQKDGQAIRAASRSAVTDAGLTYYTGTMTICNAQGAAFFDSDYYTMSSFSSWGIPGSLELKPEITAPGGNIWSVDGVTTSGTAYELMSGTSMAAPQVSGMAALTAEYIKAYGLEEKTGESIRHLAQSLLMSTAVPMLEEDSGSYYPVLRQGAGLARVDLATTAESYITVGGMADGKVKVELGEDPGRNGNYAFSFTIHNFSDGEMTYDLRADLFTQNVFDGGNGTMYLDTQTRMLGSEARFSSEDVVLEGMEEVFRCDLNGDGVTNAQDADHLLEYLVENVYTLHADGDVDGDGTVNSYDAHVLLMKLAAQGGGNRVTVPAGTDVTIDVELTLTEETRAFLAEYYPVGAYIQGYVFAEPAQGVAHSIPVLGYYGSWTEPSMFDVGSWLAYDYGTEDRAPYLYSLNGIQSNFVSMDYGDGDEYLFGGNPITQEAEYLPRRNAFNNTRGYMLKNLYYTLIRNAETMSLALRNVDTGEVLFREALDDGYGAAAYYHTNTGSWQNTRKRLSLGLGLEGIAEGTELELTLTAVPELYGDSGPLGQGANLTTTFTIDNTAPELLGWAQNGNTLTVTARDNEYIAALVLMDSTGSTAFAAEAANQTEENAETTISLDLSQVYGSEFLLAVYDYAENVTAIPLELTLDNERPYFTAINRTDGNGSYAGINADGSYVNLAAVSGRNIPRAAEYVDGYVFEVTEDNKLYVGSDEALFSFRYLGELDPEGTYDTMYFIDLAYSKADGELYGTFYSSLNNMNMPYFCTIDMLLGTMEVLGTLPVDVNSLAADGEGNFYGSGYGTSKLYTFRSDAVTIKKYTLVGSLDGYKTSQINSMAWDHNENALYWACTEEDNVTHLLQLDPQTAQVTPVRDLPFLAAGLYIAWEELGDTFAPTDQVQSISLPETETTLAGQSVTLQAELKPWNLSDPGLVWSSSDPSVATVDENGVVTGVSGGTAVITAAAKLDSTKTASCTVTVKALEKTLKGLVWDEEGQVWWSEFRTDGLPDYTKLSAVNPNLPVNATMMANGVLYASTLDSTNMQSDLYTVDPDTFAMTKVGASSVAYPDMAYAPSLGYGLGVYMNYVLLIDLQTGEYLGAWDWSEGLTADLVGITYCGSEYNDDYEVYMDHILLLDANGNVYQDAFINTGSQMGYFKGPELGYAATIGDAVDYSYFQGFHFDGEFVYWSRFNEADNQVELIAWDLLGGGESYHLGTFPDGVWPVGGLYTDDQLSESSLELSVEGQELHALQEKIVPENRIRSSGSVDDDGTVHISVSLNTAAPHALAHVTYNPSVLRLKEVRGMTGAFAWSQDIWSGEEGLVRLAFADREARYEWAELIFEPLGEGQMAVNVKTWEPWESQQTVWVDVPHVCPSAQFVDVRQTQWFHGAVDYVVSRGYMNGMDAAHFGPDIRISRAQFLTVLWRMAGSPETELTDKFTDVAPNRFYSKAVAWAVEAGITSGMTPTTFAPDGELTRAQLVTFMYRYAAFKGFDTSATASLEGYDDASSVPKFAQEPLRWALTHGIITGMTTTTLVPDGKATRAQAATIFQRFDVNLIG